MIFAFQGRKQLIEDTKELAGPYVAPYISSVKESTAPYVAKLDELRRSERVEAMIEAFNEAREHPAEKVSELKAKAVDLIKYDALLSYRNHVMSAEFQADTTRLVKELPMVATAAAKSGAEKVKETATALAEEIEGHKTKVKELVASGYDYASEIDVEAFKAKVAAMSATLVKELHSEVSLGVEQYKTVGFSMADVIERLKRVGSVMVLEGKGLLAPKETEADEAEAADEIGEAGGDADDEDCEEDEAPVHGSDCSESGDKYEDAVDELSVAPAAVTPADPDY